MYYKANTTIQKEVLRIPACFMGLGDLAVGYVISVFMMGKDKWNKANNRKDERYGMGSGC